MLLCRVTRVRRSVEDGSTWAVLDAGCNVAEPLTSETHQLFPLTSRPSEAATLHRLTGPNCALADVLYPAWRMPEVRAGDGLAVMDSGAYFIPFSTCFSRPRPGVVLVDNGVARVLRRAERFEDLVALDDSSDGARAPTPLSLASRRRASGAS